jgi:glutathione S-transferase
LTSRAIVLGSFCSQAAKAWIAAGKGLDIDFTVADLNLASILSWARPARIDLSGVPKMADWLQRCALRPPAKAARELQR